MYYVIYCIMYLLNTIGYVIHWAVLGIKCDHVYNPLSAGPGLGMLSKCWLFSYHLQVVKRNLKRGNISFLLDFFFILVNLFKFLN